MIKRPLCLTMILLLIGKFLLLEGFWYSPEPSAIEQIIREGTTVSLKGTVFRKEEGTTYQTVYIKNIQINYNLQEMSATDSVSHKNDDQIINESKILIYIEKTDQEAEKLSIGNIIEVKGKISFWDTATNPGNFNQKFYYQKQGFHAYVFGQQINILDFNSNVVKERLFQLRKKWKETLITHMGEKYGGSMSAILLGDKTQLDAETKILYQKSGIGHILAISGLHMSFIGISFYKLLRKMGASFKISGFCGAIFLVLYTYMIGCGVSSLRALIMFIIRIGAEISGRVYDLPTSLSVAAAGIIFWQPLYLYDAGFLLSFGAILAIVVVEPIFRFYKVVPKSLSGGIAIQLVTFPIVLYFYFEMPLYSQILNIFIIPLMSVVLGAGIIGSLLCFVWTKAGDVVLKICSFILWIYDKLCEISMRLPGARIITGQPKMNLIFIYYGILFVILLILWRKKEQKERESAFWEEKS